MKNGIDIRTFGAKGDGVADDTAAIQKALDGAAAARATVHVPDGVFLSSSLKVPPHVGLVGNPTWGYREAGGAVLRLKDPKAVCLLDITGAVGATLNGLSLEGENLGDGIHGIMAGVLEDKKEEDSPRIERCRISRFSGDGIRLDPIWLFSIRSCMVCFNRGHGIRVRGWDGFILDNWLSGNIGAGYSGEEANAAVTMTGNRVEWNHGGGIKVHGGSHYNITGNYIDRSGGPAISLMPRNNVPCLAITVTGNVIYRSGKPEWTTEKHDSTHLRFELAHGLVCSGNTLCVGADDSGGKFSPDYCIVVRGLKNSVIKDNAMHIGALREILVDLGDHGDEVVIKDNVGSLYTDAPKTIWESNLR